MNPQDITYFAETDFRGKRTKFGIKAEDRSRHVYVIGKTGMGKSTLLENMAIQDIQNGNGVAFIDPHGGTAEKLLDYVPASRINDVVYFAPFDLDYPVSFNVMEDIGKDLRHLVVNGLMSAFKKIWVDAWSARMEYILSNTLLALLEYPGSTLLGVNRMLSDKEYRRKVVENVTDPSVRSFWVDEFANYTERMAAESVPAIQNKIGQFTSNPLIRNIIGQPKSSFDFRQVMDGQKILIINLSKGRMGESNANLLGSMIITKIYLAAMSRANVPAPILRTLPPFYFFVDEFQSFANESFANILSEARKYKLSLTIAHQYVEQMSEEVRAAVFGNVGSIISYRVGPFDAEIFEKIFGPTFMKEDMVNLGLYQMYLTLMINGVGSQPFSARGMGPIPQDGPSHREEIIAASRKNFAYTRQAVEAEINKWHEENSTPKAPPRESRGVAGAKSGYGAARAGAPRPAVSPRASVAVPSSPPPSVVAPVRPVVSTPTPASASTPRTSVPGPAPAPVTSVGMKEAIAKAVAVVKTSEEASPTVSKVLSPPRENRGLSLKALQQNTDDQRNKGTGRHAADLKDVLRSVQAELKAALPPKETFSSPKPAAPPSAPPLPPTPPPIKTAKPEVPEDELRRMLKV